MATPGIDADEKELRKKTAVTQQVKDVSHGNLRSSCPSAVPAFPSTKVE
jgi:hypothetical protein